jgi:hypothetical protein
MIDRAYDLFFSCSRYYRCRVTGWQLTRLARRGRTGGARIRLHFDDRTRAELKLEGHTSSHLVQIQWTQNEADVVQNTELIAIIANQQAAEAVRKAVEDLAAGADPAVALQHLTDAKISLNLCCPAPELASEAAALLDEHEQKIRSQEIDSRARKNMRYEARYYGQTSSARLYTGSGKKSGFTKKPTVGEQLDQKPTTEEPKSPGEQGNNTIN